MATTSFGTNNQLAVKLFSKKLFQEALKQTWMSRFIGKDSNSLIQFLDETAKGPGDKITYGLRMQLSNDGVLGDGTLEGSEEALATHSDSFVINQLRNAVRSDGRMSDQRIPFSVREQALQGLADWWADRIDSSAFNQLTGNTGLDTRLTGNNSVTAPSSNNKLFANGDAASGAPTTDAEVASASSSNTMQLKFIDRAVQKAKTNSPAIRPIKINGEEFYVFFLHPFQVTDMKQNTGTGQWLDVQKAALAGYAGKDEVKSNPIFSGALGMYNNVILHESTRIPRVAQNAGDSGTNKGAYRAVLCGAQAGVIGFGQDNSDMKASWVEELFDYGNQLGVSAGMIYGLKKSIFNSQDFGVITLSTYAAGV